MAEPDDPSQPEDYAGIGEQIGTGLLKVALENFDARKFAVLLGDVIGVIIGGAATAAAPIGIGLAKGMANAEDVVAPHLADMAATAVSDMFGTDIPASTFQSRSNRGGRNAAAGVLGAGFMKAIEGQGGPLEPSDAAAQRYLTTVLSMALDGWWQGWFFEFMSSLIPQFDVGKIESFADLDDTVSQALGLGRLSRRVISPLLDATVVTPLRWKVNKQYRPELLSVASVVEATLAGRYNIELAREELARQGYSEPRIDVLFENAKKRLSFGDLVETWLRGGVARHDVIARAGDLGYDAATAEQLLALAEAKHRDRWKDPIVDAAVTAFIARDLDESDLRRLVEANAPTHQEAQFIISAAKVRRDLRVRSLSSGEARRLATKKILSVIDYRRALEREGYEPEAVTSLELELRMELAEQADAEQARRDLEEERAREKAEEEREREEREAELAARRALPSLQEYRRAYVRGHVSRDLFEQAIAREKAGVSPADLALLIADADSDRNAYLERLAEKERIEARRHDQTVSIAQLEESVMRDILTLGEFDARLAQRKLPDDERQLLVRMLADRLEDRDEAIQRRREAEARATAAQVSLPDMERAVRLGLRTREDYRALLQRVGTPEVQIALVLDLLDRQMADDAAARQRREQHEAELAAQRRTAEETRDARERERLLAEAQRAIPLALRRRAVVAGVRPRSYYEASLVAAGWSADDSLTELALLDIEMQQAAAARARRLAIEAEAEAQRIAREEQERQREAALALQAQQRAVPVANYRRAVLAGLMDVAAYGASLIAAGWTDAARAVEIALVEHELAELAAAVARRTQIEQDIAARREISRLREEERERIRQLPPPPPELTLAQIERAVILGIAPPDELRAFLYERGYDAADVELVVALAVARIPDVREAERVEGRIEIDLAAKGVQLADLKRAVKRGIRTLDEYSADIEARGYSADDAALLRQLLDEELAVDMDGLRQKVEAALAKTEGAPLLGQIVEAFAAGELDVSGVRDVLIMSGVARDTALVFARLLAAYGLEG